MKKSLIHLATLCCMAQPAMAADSIGNMFSEGTLRGQLQLFDFQRDFDGTTLDRRDTTFGGLFYYRSGEANGISFGGSFASANPIWETNDAVYGLASGPVGREGDRNAINRAQEYFVTGNWFDTKITVGAQELFTPMMNIFPLRALPFTYRGASIKNTSIDNLAITGLYIEDFMGWTSDEFEDVADGVAGEFARRGISVDVEDNPIYALGLDYTIPTDMVKAKASAWYYTMEDVYDQTYIKLHVSGDIGAANWYFKPSYLKQDSIGSESASSFDTYQAGFHLGMKWNGFDATVKYVQTGDDNILAPFGDEKVIIQQVIQSARANEDAYGAQLAYRFAPDSALSGVSAYINYAKYEVDGAQADIDETDVQVRYNMSQWIDGLSLRLRHAIVNQDAGDDLTDSRVYFYYKFKIG